MNKFADLAFRYVSDPNEAVKELGRFVHEGYGMLRYDSKLGHYKYAKPFGDVHEWADSFREFTEAIELAIPHSTRLKLIDVEVVRGYIHTVVSAEQYAEIWESPAVKKIMDESPGPEWKGSLIKWHDEKESWAIEFLDLLSSVRQNLSVVEKNLALETLLVQSSTVAASTSSKQPPQESEEEILKKWFPRPDGRKTAKDVLKHTRTGKSQRQITGLVGKSPPTVSEITKKLREAGLLPDA